jgi:hypothetical protein
VSGSGGAVEAGTTAQIMVDRNGKGVPVNVYVRLTNQTQAAVEPLQADRLAAGDRVVVGTKAAHRSGASNQNGPSPVGAGAIGGMRGLH